MSGKIEELHFFFLEAGEKFPQHQMRRTRRWWSSIKYHKDWTKVFNFSGRVYRIQICYDRFVDDFFSSHL